MMNFMLALLLHLPPLAKLCAFEEMPIANYTATRIWSQNVTTEKECMIACYNNPECTIAEFNLYSECFLYKEGPGFFRVHPDINNASRLLRNLIRPTCPKLASLP